MAVRIKTEKLVIRGEKCRKILQVTGVMNNGKLPAEYTGLCPYFVRTNEGNGIDVYTTHEWCATWAITPGKVLNEHEFGLVVKALKQAGKHLHELRQEEKALKETWKGEETVII